MRNRKCRVCGCTQLRPEAGGPHRSEPGLCSRCKGVEDLAAEAVRWWLRAYSAWRRSEGPDRLAAEAVNRAHGVAVRALRSVPKGVLIEGRVFTAETSNDIIRIRRLDRREVAR